MYVISYDITTDRIRTKVAKTMEGYGRRIQYSVFECELDKKRFQKLYAELCKLMLEEKNGNIKIYYICENCQKKTKTIGVDDMGTYYKKDEVIVI